MQKIAIFSLLFICNMTAFGQITVTNASFPAAGDTLRNTIDFSPLGITMTPAGVDQEWDYLSLNQGVVLENITNLASEGSVPDEFPTADLVQDYLINTEGYFNVTPTKFELVGLKGPQFAGINLEVPLQLNPGIIERVAPLNFLSELSNESSVLLPIGNNAFLDSLLVNVPILNSVDSFRIKLDITRDELVDAYGHIKIPGGEFDVLRMKRHEESEVRLEIKSIFGWIDVTGLVAVGFGGSFGRDTTNTYSFWAEGVKEPIMVATMNNTNDEVVRVQFKFIEIVSANNDLAKLRIFQINPNPTSGLVRFELENVDNAQRLIISDMRGVNVWNSNVNGQQSFYADLMSLSSGTYICTLLDEKGAILSSEQLMINR